MPIQEKHFVFLSNRYFVKYSPTELSFHLFEQVRIFLFSKSIVDTSEQKQNTVFIGNERKIFEIF